MKNEEGRMKKARFAGGFDRAGADMAAVTHKVPAAQPYTVAARQYPPQQGSPQTKVYPGESD
jgi:hypothetical protein